MVQTHLGATEAVAAQIKALLRNVLGGGGDILQTLEPLSQFKFLFSVL